MRAMRLAVPRMRRGLGAHRRGAVALACGVLVAGSLVGCTTDEEPVEPPIGIPEEIMVEDVELVTRLEMADPPAFSEIAGTVTNHAGEPIWLLPGVHHLVPDIAVDGGVVLVNDAPPERYDGPEGPHHLPQDLGVTPLAAGTSAEVPARFSSDSLDDASLPQPVASLRSCVAFVRDSALREEGVTLDPAAGEQKVSQHLLYLRQEFACSEAEPLR